MALARMRSKLWSVACAIRQTHKAANRNATNLKIPTLKVGLVFILFQLIRTQQNMKFQQIIHLNTKKYLAAKE